ncbi:MAG: hypothetical protein L7U83_09260 [Akkermansiaceae bacterium]|nr:hypothetical protein [Akkermansiaceae bacterium]
MADIEPAILIRLGCWFSGLLFPGQGCFGESSFDVVIGLFGLPGDRGNNFLPA